MVQNVDILFYTPEAREYLLKLPAGSYTLPESRVSSLPADCQCRDLLKCYRSFDMRRSTHNPADIDTPDPAAPEAGTRRIRRLPLAANEQVISLQEVL